MNRLGKTRDVVVDYMCAMIYDGKGDLLTQTLMGEFFIIFDL